MFMISWLTWTNNVITKVELELEASRNNAPAIMKFRLEDLTCQRETKNKFLIMLINKFDEDFFLSKYTELTSSPSNCKAESWFHQCNISVAMKHVVTLRRRILGHTSGGTVSVSSMFS